VNYEETNVEWQIEADEASDTVTVVKLIRAQKMKLISCYEGLTASIDVGDLGARHSV